MEGEIERKENPYTLGCAEREWLEASRESFVEKNKCKHEPDYNKPIEPNRSYSCIKCGARGILCKRDKDQSE